MSEAPKTISSRIGKGRALLGGFVPRKTRTLACRLPSCEEPAAAIAVCRTWDGVTNYHAKGMEAFLDWPRIRTEWLAMDVFHQRAVAEIDRQVEAYGEALFAINEETDAKPRRLFIMTPHDETRWRVVMPVDFKIASLGEAQV
ncbi:hypothetical protein K3163_05545 [Qipengyuania sp. 1NDW9]|uniref:hypothetical protein n=1 Tax=Qipengyuania xiapuensis TaxID=2867236 RepID=UPI001C883CD8|nr:hypothetical protein [Qipengyuania xiapuensis]MBX7492666.1 hypothetical protein [Qipengyuania xiapuensis]